MHDGDSGKCTVAVHRSAFDVLVRLVNASASTGAFEMLVSNRQRMLGWACRSVALLATTTLEMGWTEQSKAHRHAALEGVDPLFHCGCVCDFQTVCG
jgi:hypothetical protein